MQMELLKTDSYFKDTGESSPLLKKMRTKALSNESNHFSVCFKNQAF